MNRIQALRAIEAVTREWALVVTCGATARELATITRSDRHLPLLDSMGLTCAVGLGVALGSARRVGVVDGDGSLLMGFSILPTLASLEPPNLTVTVLDNRQHASADAMASQAATVDLERACSGFGFPVEVVDDEIGLESALRSSEQRGVFSFLVARIERGNSPGVPLFLADPAVLGARFSEGIAPGAERSS